MRIKTFILSALILTPAFITCNKATPAGFWKNYEPNFLINNISDQGPYGGYRAIYWKADKTKNFSSNIILGFANINGWTLVDSSSFSADQTSKWTFNNQQVFPLTSAGFSDVLVNSVQPDRFPRWFGGPLEVYTFKTGWVTIQPGTDNSTEENGFVLLSNDHKQMAVYHLWGE